MKDIILSTPEAYLYLVPVAVLILTTLWTPKTGPPAGESGATALMTGRGVVDPPAAARWDLGQDPLGVSGWQSRGACRPFWDLQAALSASYAARLEQAIRTIRDGTPVEAGPIDQAEGPAAREVYSRPA
jgi:hypothetical protein